MIATILNHGLFFLLVFLLSIAVAGILAAEQRYRGRK